MIWCSTISTTEASVMRFWTFCWQTFLFPTFHRWPKFHKRRSEYFLQKMNEGLTFSINKGSGLSNFMDCDFGAGGLCLIFLQTLRMKSNFVTFVPCNRFVIFSSNLDKFLMKNVNISYQQLLEDLQCYFCQFMPRYNIGIYNTTWWINDQCSQG